MARLHLNQTSCLIVTESKWKYKEHLILSQSHKNTLVLVPYARYKFYQPLLTPTSSNYQGQKNCLSGAICTTLGNAYCFFYDEYIE